MSLGPGEEELLEEEEEAGVVLMRAGPGSRVGVGEAGAVRGEPSWSLATTGESDVNFRTRSLTEPARRNWEGPARGVGSGGDEKAVSGWVREGPPRT